jgi:hypothetical protein
MTFTTAGLILGGASGISSIFAGKTAQYGYEAQQAAGEVTALSQEAQAAAREVQAQQAVSDAKMTNLKLTRSFNDIQAANAVMGAMSGRSFSSPTVLNMARVDQERLNWDIDYSTRAGEIGRIGISADAMGMMTSAAGTRAAAYGYGQAGKASMYSGISQGLLGGISSAAKYSQIG